MTTLITWVGVDSRGPSSIYLASDSRISWNKQQTWDTGRKLFTTKTSPDIFGYSGDVTFPMQVLSQIVDQVDNGLFFGQNEQYPEKLNRLVETIKNSFSRYPKKQTRSFSILYVSRTDEGMKSKFYATKITWSATKDWSLTNLEIPSFPALIDGSGSGSESVRDWYIRWQSSDSSRTSRAVFSAFCESLKNGDDPLSGGAPQLVGLYRTGNAKVFGIIFNKQRYLNGQSVNDNVDLNKVEWRNDLFERCDGRTLELLEDAQTQPRPNFTHSKNS